MKSLCSYRFYTELVRKQLHATIPSLPSIYRDQQQCKLQNNIDCWCDVKYKPSHFLFYSTVGLKQYVTLTQNSMCMAISIRKIMVALFRGNMGKQHLLHDAISLQLHVRNFTLLLLLLFKIDTTTSNTHE